MPLYKMHMSFGADTALLKDRIVNTFYLNDQGVTTNPNSLAADAINLFQTYYGTVRFASCTVYEVDGPPPHYPVGYAQENPGVNTASISPRELALCLSYFADRNLPRQRGRIYLASCLNTAFAQSVRPTLANRAAALTLATGLHNLGGVDVDWQVYSPTDGVGRNVTRAWCDDEWDTIRSRGLSATTREEVAIDEG